MPVASLGFDMRRGTKLKPCPHCRKKVRLSHKSEIIAENGEKTATVSLLCNSLTFLRRDSRTFLRQCGQGLSLLEAGCEVGNDLFQLPFRFVGKFSGFPDLLR